VGQEADAKEMIAYHFLKEDRTYRDGAKAAIRLAKRSKFIPNDELDRLAPCYDDPEA